MKAVVLGATGVVGKEIVKELLQSKQFEQINIVVRRKLGIVHPRLIQHLFTGEQVEQFPASIFKDAHVYCALGTTKKKAKTKEQFRKIDYDMVYDYGKLAKMSGCVSFTLVSAIGADARSVFFYNKVKGEIEQAMLELQLPRFYVVRPSLILGERDEKRVGEALAIKWSKRLPFMFNGPMKRYAPIDAKLIAKSMIKISLLANEPYLLVQSHQIEHWAKKKYT